MQPSPVALVTVSREYGAGGSEFAHALGACLGWPVLDREIVYHVAERLELDAALVARLDEHPPSRLSRLAAALFVAPPEAPACGVVPYAQLPPDAVADAVRAVITAAAARGPLVVVGHGTQCLYRGRRDALHVRLVAPAAARARRLHARLGGELEAAAEAARRMDSERGRYIRRHYGHDWSDPLLYDLQLNTGRLTPEDAAVVVAAFVRGTPAGHAPPAG